MLIERINTDWSMQLFCGIALRPGERILDKNLPSAWRTYLGQHMKIKELQEVFAKYWRPFMDQTYVGMQDATCYESRISYPTDNKLLWNCCKEMYNIIQDQRKILGLRKTRSNYSRQNQKYYSYQKNRKKSRRQEKKVRKQLLNYLSRLIELYSELAIKYTLQLSNRKKKKLETIEKIYRQQHQKVYGDKNSTIEDRIVSLHKPYVRPIVRGKEVKPVEFGAKVNKLQVDGISFIEHISYDAFNETTRYKEGIYLQRKLFGKCTHHSADAIYATNVNRTYARSQNIQTNFIPKGRQKQQYIEQSETLRQILNKQRATVLEGSFGNEKNHYLLNRIAARNQDTELCWIFFGMMTANASIIANRIEKQQKTRAA